MILYKLHKHEREGEEAREEGQIEFWAVGEHGASLEVVFLSRGVKDARGTWERVN